MRNKLAQQFDQLNDNLDTLQQPITMLNVLRNRTDLDKLEICELQYLLSGIETLLNHHLASVQDRIAFITKIGGNDE